MTELELFLENFKSSEHVSLCSASSEFTKKWESYACFDKLMAKACIFIYENGIKNFKIGAFHLFEPSKNYECTLHEHKQVRIDFLEWCISKGYTTINDLFK